MNIVINKILLCQLDSKGQRINRDQKPIITVYIDLSKFDRCQYILELDNSLSDREHNSSLVDKLQTSLTRTQNDNETMKSEVQVLGDEYLHLKKGMDILAKSFGIEADNQPTETSSEEHFTVPVVPRSDLPDDPTLDDLKKHVFGHTRETDIVPKAIEDIPSTPRTKTIHDSIIKQSNLVLKTLLEAADLKKDSDESLFHWQDINKSIADSLIQESEDNIEGKKGKVPVEPKMEDVGSIDSEKVDSTTLNKIQDIIDTLLQNQLGYSVKIALSDSNELLLQLSKPKSNGPHATDLSLPANGLNNFSDGENHNDDIKAKIPDSGPRDGRLGDEEAFPGSYWEHQHKQDRRNMEEEYEKLRKKRLAMLLQAYTGNDCPRLQPEGFVPPPAVQVHPPQATSDQERIQQILAKYDLVPSKTSTHQMGQVETQDLHPGCKAETVTDYNLEAEQMLKESQSIKDRLQLMREHLNRAESARTQVGVYHELEYRNGKASLNNSVVDDTRPSTQPGLHSKSREEPVDSERNWKDVSPARYTNNYSHSTSDSSLIPDATANAFDETKYGKPLSAVRAYKSALKSRLRSSRSSTQADVKPIESKRSTCSPDRSYYKTRDYELERSPPRPSSHSLARSTARSLHKTYHWKPHPTNYTSGSDRSYEDRTSLSDDLILSETCDPKPRQTDFTGDLGRPNEDHGSLSDDRSRLYNICSYRTVEPGDDSGSSLLKPYSSSAERTALLAKYSAMVRSYENLNKTEARPVKASPEPDLVITRSGDVIPRDRSSNTTRRVHFSKPSSHTEYSSTTKDKVAPDWREPMRFFSTTLSVAEPSRLEASRARDKLGSLQEFRTRQRLSDAQKQRANNLIDRYVLAWKRRQCFPQGVSSRPDPLANRDSVLKLLEMYDQLWQGQDTLPEFEDQLLDESLDVDDIVSSYFRESAGIA
ncbi:hypothetical protein CAPTEDRAFT_185620 [Capitella teleta]|uniref:Uncharacterized protein n=1 Tax=Capitella teleta TaxID=283909 RepID=R7VFS4_CAPTE|nr:hypothetical protein CAPTEDRAFT_185620 [Capitella teleta]|eukprot:ELU15146.1 hypothetical protein CAPTEDRAFT_185620 [Capitella teleta]